MCFLLMCHENEMCQCMKKTSSSSSSSSSWDCCCGWDCDECFVPHEWRTLPPKLPIPINPLSPSNFPFPFTTRFPCLLHPTSANVFNRIEKAYLDENSHCERIATSWPVTVIWAAVSMAVAAAALLSLVQPTWFVKKEKRSNHDFETFMFGVISFCYRLNNSDEQLVCRFYGDLWDVNSSLPVTWLATCVLQGSGCVALLCSALATLASNALPTPSSRKHAALAIGMLQAGAVLILLMSLVLFPVGLNSAFVKHHCGAEAAAFSAGDCQLGWGYALALMATLTAVYCPVLSLFTSYKLYYKRHKIKVMV